MVKLVAEPETVVKIRRVVAERETLLEFTVRVGAEPDSRQNRGRVVANGHQAYTVRHIFEKGGKSSANSYTKCKQPQTFPNFDSCAKTTKKYTPPGLFSSARARGFVIVSAGTRNTGAREQCSDNPNGWSQSLRRS